jgi:hypothetical protein
MLEAIFIIVIFVVATILIYAATKPDTFRSSTTSINGLRGRPGKSWTSG